MSAGTLMWLITKEWGGSLASGAAYGTSRGPSGNPPQSQKTETMAARPLPPPVERAVARLNDQLQRRKVRVRMIVKFQISNDSMHD